MTDLEKILAEEYGIVAMTNQQEGVFREWVDSPARGTSCIIPHTPEPKRPVSPYAKFDKFHHKKKRK
ncbi:MAG: hypothetical protein K2N48_01360 [Muribaculaceae bacterium]|nr:hypothetical protein [Muribaculaceae bacterium]